MADLCDACLAGDFARAREIHTRLDALMKTAFVESNPIPIKAALALHPHLEGVVDAVQRLETQAEGQEL